MVELTSSLLIGNSRLKTHQISAILLSYASAPIISIISYLIDKRIYDSSLSSILPSYIKILFLDIYILFILIMLSVVINQCRADNIPLKLKIVRLSTAAIYYASILGIFYKAGTINSKKTILISILMYIFILYCLTFKNIRLRSLSLILYILYTATLLPLTSDKHYSKLLLVKSGAIVHNATIISNNIKLSSAEIIFQNDTTYTIEHNNTRYILNRSSTTITHPPYPQKPATPPDHPDTKQPE
jgi:hypothetical protein